MRITRDQIKELNKRYKQLEEAEIQASEALKKVKDESGDNKLKVNRAKEGEHDKWENVKESDLWVEVYHLGNKGGAYEALNKKYPEVFRLYKKQNILAEDLKAWAINELGVDYTKIKLSDIINITDAIVKSNKLWYNIGIWIIKMVKTLINRAKNTIKMAESYLLALLNSNGKRDNQETPKEDRQEKV